MISLSDTTDPLVAHQLQEALHSIALDADHAGKDREKSLQAIAVTTRLYDMISDQDDIDHPLCRDCAALFVSMMNAQLDGAKESYERVETCLKELQVSENVTAVDQSEEEALLHQDILSLEKEQKRILEEENRLKQDEEKLLKEIQQLSLDLALAARSAEQLSQDKERFGVSLHSFLMQA